MTKVVAIMSMSLDGYVADQGVTVPHHGRHRAVSGGIGAA